MSFYRMITCCVVCSLLFCIQASAEEKPPHIEQKCAVKLLASFNAATSEDGRLYVPARIGGKIYYFIIDTGGLISLFNENLARDLKFSIARYASRNPKDSLRDKEELRDAGGGSVVNSTIVPQMELGGIELKNEKFALIPGMGFSGAGSSEPIVAGSLGQKFLMKYDVELDPLNKKVRFFSQEHCEGNVVYWSKTYFEVPFKQEIPIQDSLGSLSSLRNRFRDFNPDVSGMKTSTPFLPVFLDGKRIQASIDTGSGTSFLDLDKAESTFDIDPERDQLPQAPDSRFVAKQGLKTYRHQFKTLQLGGVAFLNPTFHLADLAHGRDMPRMIIGMDRLKQMRFYIAYKEGIIYGTPADAKDAEAIKPNSTPKPVTSSP